MERISRTLSLALLLVALVGVSYAQQGHGNAGAVYTMTNDTTDNKVVMFLRAADGTLTPAGSFSTEGQGTGGGLGNQGGLVLSHDHRWLFAVNAWSNTVSVFGVAKNGLELSDQVYSGGDRPVSVTAFKNILYVLNAGANNGIAGFRISHDGQLMPIPGSIQPLSQPGAGGAQISFDPNGNVLVVTEKATNQIVTYTVDKDGVASLPAVHASSGPTPFGFDFGLRGQFLVSEAAGGGPGASSVSSYQLSPDGGVVVVSASVPTNQTAACWLVVTTNGRFAITSNTPNDSLSTFLVGFDGSIARRDANGRTGVTDAGVNPLDSALTIDSHFLYALNSGNGGISGFRVESDGGLTPISTGISAGSLPLSSNGMAAR